MSGGSRTGESSACPANIFGESSLGHAKSRRRIDIQPPGAADIDHSCPAVFSQQADGICKIMPVLSRGVIQGVEQAGPVEPGRSEPVGQVHADVSTPALPDIGERQGSTPSAAEDIVKRNAAMQTEADALRG